MDADAREGALLPVAPGYKNVLRVRLAVVWVPLIVAAIILDQALEGEVYHGLPSTLVPLLALITVSMAPQRIYRHLRYRLDASLLQVVRGWMFHTDTIVPVIRVQHIDVKRGPLEKMFGTATLVVHTAGTHNSIVTVPGLEPIRAEEVRDIIREHVRTDFE